MMKNNENEQIRANENTDAPVMLDDDKMDGVAGGFSMTYFESIKKKKNDASAGGKILH